jgi:aryl-alcohol dehydrogenase-like predicted oxidoreductase
MDKVPLGQTGVEVSALCLGTMYFGSLTDEAAAFQILDHYVGLGGTFLDTANIYAAWLEGYVGGESETVIGRWLKKRGNRDRMFIATKVGGVLHRGNTPLYPDAPRLRAAQVISECQNSLRRLGIDTIDLYYAHMDDRSTPLEETLEGLTRLIKSGQVRFIGASNISAWRLAEARLISDTLSLARYCCVQQRYTYLRPTPRANFAPQVAVNDELLAYVRAKNITLLAYSPLLSGAYTRPDSVLPEQYVGPDSEARMMALNTVAAEHNATANQIVLAWLCQNSPQAVPLIGVENVDQLNENLASQTIVLSDAQLAHLNNAGT